jgi:hypothetical protein
VFYDQMLIKADTTNTLVMFFSTIPYESGQYKSFTDALLVFYQQFLIKSNEYKSFTDVFWSLSMISYKKQSISMFN